MRSEAMATHNLVWTILAPRYDRSRSKIRCLNASNWKNYKKVKTKYQTFKLRKHAVQYNAWNKRGKTKFRSKTMCTPSIGESGSIRRQGEYQKSVPLVKSRLDFEIPKSCLHKSRIPALFENGRILRLLHKYWFVLCPIFLNLPTNRPNSKHEL